MLICQDFILTILETTTEVVTDGIKSDSVSIYDGLCRATTWQYLFALLIEIGQIQCYHNNRNVPYDKRKNTLQASHECTKNGHI